MIGGKKVKIMISPEPDGYDDGDNTVQTLALFKKAVFDDKVLAVKGITRSISVETLFNYLKEIDKQGAGTVLISPESSSPGLGGITPWGFRNAFFESSQLDRELGLLKSKFGYKTAAVFVVRDNPYNTSIFDSTLTPLLKKHDIKVLTVVDGFEKTPSDFSREVSQLREANADFIMVSATGQVGVNLMKEAGRRGFKPNMWLGTVGQLSPDVARLGGKAAERMVIGAGFSPTSPSVLRLSEEYKKRFGTEVGQYGLTSYDVIYLLKTAIESTTIANTPDKLQQDRAKLRDAIAKVSITGAAGGKVAFEPNGDAISEGVMLTIKDGKFVEWDGKAFP
jgi:ABC-type branched-subunit amino acid transport system substrate-binding protein